jgi:hypothetical protein
MPVAACHHRAVAVYEVALVLLVDSSGAVLMQHRDDRTSVSPNQWSLPGGHVEAGELPEQAAHRELLEEAAFCRPVSGDVLDGGEAVLEAGIRIATAIRPLRNMTGDAGPRLAGMPRIMRRVERRSCRPAAPEINDRGTHRANDRYQRAQTRSNLP